MEKNKSIDGLTVKKPATKKTAAKTVKTAKPIKATKTTVKKVEVKKTKEPATDSKPVAKAEDFLQPVTSFNFDGGELKAAEESAEDIKKVAKDKKPKKEKKKVSKTRIIITSILLVIVLAMLGFVTWLVLWGDDLIAKITGGNGNIWDALNTLTSETYEPLKTDENGRTNILAFGTSGYNMEGDEGNGTHDGAQLTDSIMAISIDQATGDIVMISLPRDLKVTPTCTATGKINEVYWCNNQYGDDEAAGANALMNKVSDVLGIDFQYYVHVNWESLIDIVDIIGGITVTTDETIEYDYLNYDGGNMVETIWEGAPTTLNGRQALGIARARHATKMGDFSRGNSQQKILIGIKDQIYNANLGFPELLGLVNTLGDNMRTNMAIEDFKTAIHLTYEFDFDKMRQVPLVDYDNNIYYFTTGMINGISYVLPQAGDGNFYAIRACVAEALAPAPEEDIESTETGDATDEVWIEY